MGEFGDTTWVGTAAFVAGVVFGATVQRTHFCAMGGISDAVLFGDWRRLRAWLMAIGVAILGSQALQLAGLVDLGTSLYVASDLAWLALALGGLMFGFGMTLTGGCASRNVVRLGAGNLKSLVVLLVLGITAYMTMSGLFAYARIALVEASAVGMPGRQALPEIMAAAFGGASPAWRPVLAVVFGGGVIWFCLKDPAFRRSGRDLAAGLILGALIPAGWLITSLAWDVWAQPASFTFVGPVGNGLVYLMTFTSGALSFGVAALGGVLAGAFLAAAAAGEFRIEGFAGIDDLRRHLLGATLMGVGGVLALGCTIGQGITGVSTLAAGSFLAFFAIVAGGVAGVRYLEQGSLRGAVRALFAGG